MPSTQLRRRKLESPRRLKPEEKCEGKKQKEAEAEGKRRPGEKRKEHENDLALFYVLNFGNSYIII